MRHGNPCLGCGCNHNATSSDYCPICKSNKCSNCGGMGVISEICIQCRRARGDNV